MHHGDLGAVYRCVVQIANTIAPRRDALITAQLRNAGFKMCSVYREKTKKKLFPYNPEFR
jgi:hypothetical protein